MYVLHFGMFLFRIIFEDINKVYFNETKDSTEMKEI